MAESFRCSPETIITLLIGYTPIQNKKLKKKVFSGEVYAYNDHTVLCQVLAIPQHHSPHIAHTGAIHIDLSGSHRRTDLAGLAGEFKDASQLSDKDVSGIHTHGLSQLAMDLQMPLLAVDGQEELGLGNGE